MAIVGVLPAAGHATRLQPLSGSKEMIELGGRPVIDYAVERMRMADCREIRVVTRPEKTDVIEHARLSGLSIVLGHPRTSSESFALGIDSLDPEDVVLLGWPDILWSGTDAYTRLVEAVHAGSDVALGLFETEDDLSRWDTVTVDATGRVTGIHPKRRDPPTNVVWAPAAARRHVLDGIAGAEWPGSHFDTLCRSGFSVEGIRLPGTCTDIGTRADLERARHAPPSLAPPPA